MCPGDTIKCADTSGQFNTLCVKRVEVRFRLFAPFWSRYHVKRHRSCYECSHFRMQIVNLDDDGRCRRAPAPTFVKQISIQTYLVFKGPVAWTGKRPETGPNRTDLDRTAVAVAPPFRMDEPPATGPVKTGCNRLEILLQNTFKTHLKTLKMIKI